MKLIIFIIFSSSLYWGLLSCDNNQPKTNSPNSIIVMEKDTSFIDVFELSEEKKTSWESFFKLFLNDCFRPTLSSYKLKQDCKTCGSIYFDYTFLINDKGVFSPVSLLRTEVDCRNINDTTIKLIEERILDYLKKYSFNTSLHNTRLKARFGIVTRC